jgi:hypothetical protein
LRVDLSKYSVFPTGLGGETLSEKLQFILFLYHPFLDATFIVKPSTKVTRSERLGTVTSTEEKRVIPPFCQLMGGLINEFQTAPSLTIELQHINQFIV